jgi:hypothetical protein
MSTDQPDSLITNTPLALHPQNFTTLGDDHQNDPVVVVMRDALGNAHASWTATLTGHKKVMSDPLNTPLRNMQRSSDAAAKRQDEALRRLDAAVERGRREIEAIDEAVNRVPDPPPSYVVRMVSETMRGLSQKERGEAIAEALRDGDTEMLGAVLFCGPAKCYGLTKSERDLFRRQYQQTAYPDALKRRAALERSVELLKRGGTSLMESNAKLFDRAKLDEAAALSQAAAEALGD